MRPSLRAYEHPLSEIQTFHVAIWEAPHIAVRMSAQVMFFVVVLPTSTPLSWCVGKQVNDHCISISFVFFYVPIHKDRTNNLGLK